VGWIYKTKSLGLVRHVHHLVGLGIPNYGIAVLPAHHADDMD